jgi:hypothetical protein
MCRPIKRNQVVAAPSEVAVSKKLEQMKIAAEPPTNMVLLETIPDVLPPAFANLPSVTSADIQAELDSRPKTFVYVTYEMVCNESNAAAIGFNEDGTALEIRDVTLLTEKILPKYFRHRNVTSFYRQLNSHGFRTTHSAYFNVTHTFVHDSFKKNQPDLLQNITRKKCIPKEKAVKNKRLSHQHHSDDDSESTGYEGSRTENERSVSPTTSSSPESCDATVSDQLMKMIEELRESHKRMQEREQTLEERNRKLEADNQEILKEIDQMCSKLSQMVENQKKTFNQMFQLTSSADTACVTNQALKIENLDIDMNEYPWDSNCQPLDLETCSKDLPSGEMKPDSSFREDDLFALENLFSSSPVSEEDDALLFASL